MRLKSLAMLCQMDLDTFGDVEVDPLTLHQLSRVFLNMRSPDKCSLCNGRGWTLAAIDVMHKCGRCGGSGVIPHGEPSFDPIALGC